MDYVFVVDSGSISIASRADYDDGYNASQDVPSKITKVMDKIGCELMEGIWEVSDTDTARKILILSGLVEKPPHK